MDRREYSEKLGQLRFKHDKEISELRKECALSNNHVRKGDIIKDYGKTIRVDQIRIRGNDFPECYYVGVVLTKKGEPYKSLKEDIVLPESKGFEIVSRNKE